MAKRTQAGGEAPLTGRRSPHPKTGERRKTRRPFAIDAMPEPVRQEIMRRRAAGETWQEISDASPTFAGEKLALETLRRWYDVRVEQVQHEVAAQAERARSIAAAFAGKGFENLPESVRTALSAAVFSLAEEQDEASRGKFMKSLTDLGWLLARNRQLDQEERRLLLEAKKLDAIVAKVEGVKKAAGKKKLSSEELARTLDEIYGIASK